MADNLGTFAGRDYTAEFERLLTLLRAEVPEYTDLNHSDFGVALLRLVARETDQLNAYIDQVFAEGFVERARFRESLIELGKLVGYQPALASAAQTRLELTRTEESADDPIPVPRYSAFTRPDGLEYGTVEAVTVQPGESSVVVPAIQGTVRERELDAADFQVRDWSKRPAVNLGAGVAAGTVEVWHGYGPEIWTEVEAFWRSWPEDLHFRLDVDGDTDEVWLTLGDGTQGQGPPDETLHVRFVTTAGPAGNCGSGVITTVPDALDDLVTCTNIDSATGGAATLGRDALRRLIPAMVRTQRRAVTNEDYEALVGAIPGVLHVQCIDRNEGKEWPHEYVVLFVLPAGGGPMSVLLKERIWDQCGRWGHLGGWKHRYILKDAVEIPVPVAVRIGTAQGYSAEAVSTAVRAAIEACMSVAQMGIGRALRLGDLHATVSAVAGVSWVEFDTPRWDVTVNNCEIIVPGGVSVVMEAG
ncbi:MAG: baseplate J/gp47 family protein [Thermodesulfobacteriota bacterium]